MAYPVLKLKDGFSDKSPELQKDVKKLQTILKDAGYDVDTDGLFGKGTEDAVKAFQKLHGLVADGIVGAATWDFLYEIKKEKPDQEDEEKPEELAGFHGDLSWVHNREGHAGKPYWPGGASGVTLDPGVDLGHAKPSIVENAYRPLLKKEEYEAVLSVLGKKGQKAKRALKRNQILQKIRITRKNADKIFKYAAIPYWQAIVRRFPQIADPDTPGSVQTVMLSLSYNRGAGNRRLNILKDPIRKKDWHRLADIIGAMQQDHKLSGIRKRRRMEAHLIRAQLRS